MASIEASVSLEELRTRLHAIIQDYGFQSFSFVDVGDMITDHPFHITTIDQSWNLEYTSNGFFNSDPVIPVVKRMNIPFDWSAVPMPLRKGKRKPGALRVMEAAKDHGFENGLVIPFHFTDRYGRQNSASCVLFWKDKLSRFLFTINHKRYELHILMLYWAQQAMTIVEMESSRRRRFLNESGEKVSASVLTDRERDVLSWAARGKTMSETADILHISETTVESYIREAMRKLDAVNKTQAVVQAIYIGAIDVF